eukprot:TRINITY_DN22943_c0_g1_i2.p1 TRINITY_DN22943_c0_g1~~TRINITY_DN22943_c0_g1_i2.p1  ORF type:complete len:892 (+),score=218.25 TRINITY_DN22943_c0_g1_i2:64-2676(+)
MTRAPRWLLLLLPPAPVLSAAAGPCTEKEDTRTCFQNNSGLDAWKPFSASSTEVHYDEGAEWCPSGCLKVSRVAGQGTDVKERGVYLHRGTNDMNTFSLTFLPGHNGDFTGGSDNNGECGAKVRPKVNLEWQYFERVFSLGKGLYVYHKKDPGQQLVRTQLCPDCVTPKKWHKLEVLLEAPGDHYRFCLNGEEVGPEFPYAEAGKGIHTADLMAGYAGAECFFRSAVVWKRRPGCNSCSSPPVQPCETPSPSAGPTAAPQDPTRPPSAYPTFHPIKAGSPTRPPVYPSAAPLGRPTTTRPSGAPVPPSASPSAPRRAAPTALSPPPPPPPVPLSPPPPPPPPPPPGPPAKMEPTGATLAVLTNAQGAGVAMAMDSSCLYEGTMKELPVALHPLRFSVAGNQYIGCFIGNMSLVLGACTVCAAAVWGLLQLDESGDGMLQLEELPKWMQKLPLLGGQGEADPKAVARSPGVPITVFIFLYPGTTFAVLRIAATEGGALQIFGIVAAAVLALVPFGIAQQLDKAVALKHTRVRPWEDLVPGCAWMNAACPEQATRPVRCTKPWWLHLAACTMFGPGDWVSRKHMPHWVLRWSVARPYRAKKVGKGFAAQCVAQWLLSLANAPRTPTWLHCAHVRVAAAATHLGLIAFTAGALPHRRLRDTAVATLQHSLQLTALLLTAAGMYRQADRVAHRDDPPPAGQTRSPAGWEAPEYDPDDPWVAGLLNAAVGVLVFKLLLDVVGEGWLAVKGKRTELQQREWGDAAREDVAKDAPPVFSFAEDAEDLISLAPAGSGDREKGMDELSGLGADSMLLMTVTSPRSPRLPGPLTPVPRSSEPERETGSLLPAIRTMEAGGARPGPANFRARPRRGSGMRF